MDLSLCPSLSSACKSSTISYYAPFSVTALCLGKFATEKPYSYEGEMKISAIVVTKDRYNLLVESFSLHNQRAVINALPVSDLSGTLSSPRLQGGRFITSKLELLNANGGQRYVRANKVHPDVP